MVEDYLMKSERRDVAKEYIRYRYKREIARNGQDDFIKAFSAKLQGSDIENQNANVDEMSFGGRVGAASDLQMKNMLLITQFLVNLELIMKIMRFTFMI